MGYPVISKTLSLTNHFLFTLYNNISHNHYFRLLEPVTSTEVENIFSSLEYTPGLSVNGIEIVLDILQSSTGEIYKRVDNFGILVESIGEGSLDYVYGVISDSISTVIGKYDQGSFIMCV